MVQAHRRRKRIGWVRRRMDVKLLHVREWDARSKSGKTDALDPCCRFDAIAFWVSSERVFWTTGKNGAYFRSVAAVFCGIPHETPCDSVYVGMGLGLAAARLSGTFHTRLDALQAGVLRHPLTRGQFRPTYIARLRTDSVLLP